MLQESVVGFDQHDVRLHQPHYIHRLCQDNDTKALARTLASDKTGVNMRDENGMTPLQLTVITADPPYLDTLMLRLIKSGADLDARVPGNGNTAIHLAILYSKESNAELSVPILLREGATPAIRNHLGKTAFDYALANGYRRVAELLATVEDDPGRAKSLDPYMFANDAAGGVKPEELHAAIKAGDKQKAAVMMRQLTQMAYRESCLPLHWAVVDSPDKRAMLQELLQCDADPLQLDQAKETPITLAIKHMAHNIEMLRVIYLLMLAGVPKAQRNSENQDALSLARQHGYTDVEELLITGRNPDAAAAPKPVRRQVTIVEPTPPPTQRQPKQQLTQQPPPQTPKQQEPQSQAEKPKETVNRPPQQQLRLGKEPTSFTGQYHKLHQLVMQTKKPSIQIASEIDQLFAANPKLDPDVATNDEIGDTALHIAVRDQRARAVEALLKYNATVDIKNKNKETPLFLARSGPWGYDHEIEELLLKANQRQRDAKRAREEKERASATTAAAASQQQQQQKPQKQQQEQQPQQQPQAKPTQQSTAAAAPKPKYPDDPVNKFTGPYHRIHEIVSQTNKPGAEMAKELDAYLRANPRVDPDLKTNDEIADTALHIAVRNQKMSATRVLLDRNATVMVKNKKNETPLTLARNGPMGSDRDIEEMLLEANKKQQQQQQQQRQQQQQNTA